MRWITARWRWRKTWLYWWRIGRCLISRWLVSWRWRRYISLLGIIIAVRLRCRHRWLKARCIVLIVRADIDCRCYPGCTAGLVGEGSLTDADGVAGIEGAWNV